MKTNLQIKGMPKESQTQAEALATSRRTEFFIGWMKRFGNTLNLFVFPPNNKEHPNL
jgi:hypothetical protein